MSKFIMRGFRIDETSGVDFPAQKDARAVIMKRASPMDDSQTCETCGEKHPGLECPKSVKKYEVIEKHVVKLDNGKYQLRSKDNTKNLGTFNTKEEAETHEREVEYFRSVKKAGRPVPQENETKEQFIARYMADKDIIAHCPDEGMRMESARKAWGSGFDKYDPDQDRGEDGQWTSSGAEDAKSKAEKMASRHEKKAEVAQKKGEEYNSRKQSEIASHYRRVAGAASDIVRHNANMNVYGAADAQKKAEHFLGRTQAVAGPLFGVRKSDDNDYTELSFNDSETNGGDSMPDSEIEKLSKALDRANRIAELNDAEKSYFKTLSGEAAESFLKMASVDRSGEIKKCADLNPEVYKSVSGEVFRKNDDPRLAAMAKRADEQAVELAKAKSETETATYAKRAKEELSHSPGDEATKVALLKSVDGIKDEKLRKSALDSLHATDAGFKKNMETIGVMGGGNSNPGAAGAEEKLNILAKAHLEKSADPKKTFAKSYNAVLSTEEGRALYREVSAAIPNATPGV